MALIEYATMSTTVSTTAIGVTNGTTTIATNTDDRVIQVVVDPTAMAGGDTFAIRLYEKVRAADSQKYQTIKTFTGAQTEIWFSEEAYHVRHGWDVAVIRTAGADAVMTVSIRAAA